MTVTDTSAAAVLDSLLTDGYAVVERLLSPDQTVDFQDRVQRLLDHERAHPFDPGPNAPPPEAAAGDWYMKIWELSDQERDRLLQRLAIRQREEFDTPWPVPAQDVCISFTHIPTLFDRGRSQRV